ncbi:MAG: hypothetical protein ABFD02_18075 [Bacteroidales bacterium]
MKEKEKDLLVKGNDLTVLHSAVKFSQNPDYIFVKPMCDFFGLNYDAQVKRMKKDAFLRNCTSKLTDEFVFGDRVEHLAVTKEGFLRWSQIINPSQIDVRKRKKFEIFQSSVIPFLYGSNIIKDQYIQYLKKEMKDLEDLRKEYGRQGNEIKKKKYHIEKVMGMEYGEWKEMVETAEPAEIEGGM